MESHFAVNVNDPSTMNGLNGMAHDRQQQQHVYINPQDLRDNNPPPPPPPAPQQQPPSASIRSQPPPQQQHTQQQQQHPHPQPPPPDLGGTPILNFPLTQDLVSRLFHHLNLQAQIAQEKLDYLRRREARELKELNARKELEKTQSNRNKSEKAFVRVFFFCSWRVG
jgi:hypothetical protein